MNDLNFESFAKALTYEQAEELISTISKYFNVNVEKLIKQDKEIVEKDNPGIYLTKAEFDKRLGLNDVTSKDLYDKVTEILNYIDFDKIQRVDEILKNTAYGRKTFDFLFNRKVGCFSVARKIILGTYQYDDWDRKAFSVYREGDMFEVCLRIEPKDCSYNLKYRNGKQLAIRRAVKYFLPAFEQIGWGWANEDVDEKTIYNLFKKLTKECEMKKQSISTGHLRASYNKENNTVSLSLELGYYSDW